MTAANTFHAEIRNGLSLVSIFAIAMFPTLARGETILITPSDSYDRIENARPGDEVVIAPGTYRFRVYLRQAAPPNAPLIIRAEDPQNPPVWDLSGGYVENAPGSYTGGDRGRGCWQLNGATNIHISGLVIQECHSAEASSAGLRYYGGSAGIELKDILFRRNDNGLTGGTEDSDMSVEFCEFDSNGNLSAPPNRLTHNIYIFGGTFALRYSYLHDATQGQNFHIRARQSTLEYNWISRPRTFAGDMMCNEDCGGCAQSMLLRGNLIDQGNPENRGQIVAVFNDFHLPGFQFALTMINNTVVVTQPQGFAVHLSNADGTTMNVEMDNNLISGGRPYVTEDPRHGTVSGTNNWMYVGTDPGSLVGTVFGTNPFQNPGDRDFTLAPGSTAIGSASISVDGLPDKEYFQNESVSRRYRIRPAAYDIGAFESTTTSDGIGPYDAPGRK